MQILRDLSSFVLKSDLATLGVGFVAGAGFELFKINFSLLNVSFYKVFNERQLRRELSEFEETLVNRNKILRSRLEGLQNAN
uniref:Uncharacterized protein n=1 Tax=Globodera rostochiensis TaxID=31243 RepID=A0A914HEH9_GLORO